MKKLTKFKRIVTRIIVLTLVLSCAGGVMPSTFTPNAAELYSDKEKYISYNGETEMYEYSFYDAYVYDIDATPGQIMLDIIPSTGSNYYNYYYHKKILITWHSYNGENAAQYDYENQKLAESIQPESRINIKFAAKNKYDDLSYKDGYLGWESHKDFYVSQIISIRNSDEHIYGDINDDGIIDSFDVVTYQKYITDNLQYKLDETQFLNADIDMDTEITNEDCRQVIDFTLGSSKGFNGATNIGSIRIDNTVSQAMSLGVKNDIDFATAEIKFGVDVLKKCYDPEKNNTENILISPLSISSALAMTANGADGDTYEEMEKTLGNGLTLEQINEYMAYFISHLPDKDKEKVYLADSVWFKNDPTLKIYYEFLEKNRKFYNAEIYKSQFDETIIKDVNNWVNKNTKGKIPRLIDSFNIRSNTAMMLLNTLYFESEWQEPYIDTIDGTFTDLNGQKHLIKEMHSEEYQYFDLGNADAFKKPYLNGDYSFVGILPHEDVTFNEYVANLDGKELADGLREYADPETIRLCVMIPKFKYNYQKSLKDILTKIGMEKAFDPDNADFSNINDLSVEGALPLYIDDVLHKTKIEVTEKGTKASAATAVIMGMGAAPPEEKKTIVINLDRPFIYMIVDKNNVPLFIGAATQLSEN